MNNIFSSIPFFFAIAANIFLLGLGLYVTYLLIVFLRLGIKFLRNHSR
ncbi:hypothetical protein ACFP1I_30510 [Dyadobacter subterraneus]|uniref:Uncharacterized protein n=1 Tax=Dyadobacter subterraneus TaxID=2773304 RepID=A0ABR9W870_9BACT|nr:hypothetical protein [Dyadobacter subterraneus]MBE9461650.1 hypothetical protein [Dyadobacter subterraneus]